MAWGTDTSADLPGTSAYLPGTTADLRDDELSL